MNQILQNPYQSPAPFLSEADCDIIRRTFVKGFSEDEQQSFIRTCERMMLDPFSKQIFATRRFNKGVATMAIVTSVTGLTSHAIRSGQYDGCTISWAGRWEEENTKWLDCWLSDDYPIAARAIVKHKQRSIDEVGICRWSGYAATKWDGKAHVLTDFWMRLPDFMLGKCAKAQALRGAFPELSGIYISEELQGGISEGDHEIDDEQKIAENRLREAELLKQAAASKNVRIVESKPAKRPTPAEAAAPAEPPKPISAAPVQAPVPPEPDDLDMSEPQPEPSAEGPAESPRESAKPWTFHVIRGLKNPKYFERTVGDLSITELQAIEDQWLPKVRAIWDDVNTNQKADAEAFEAAIAYHKMENPW